MTLSDYEHRVIADLEAQFQVDAPAPGPDRDHGRFALPLICLLGGVALLAAARTVGLVQEISDLFGFTTASLRSGFSLAGYFGLLGSAFLFGRALHASSGEPGAEARHLPVVPGRTRVHRP